MKILRKPAMPMNWKAVFTCRCAAQLEVTTEDIELKYENMLGGYFNYYIKCPYCQHRILIEDPPFFIKSNLIKIKGDQARQVAYEKTIEYKIEKFLKKIWHFITRKDQYEALQYLTNIKRLPEKTEKI